MKLNKFASIKTIEELVPARFNPEFIGIGHDLEKQKKKHKSIQKQQKMLSNRVEYLQKQQTLAQKILERKKKEFETLMGVINRKKQEQQQKARLKKLREQQLQNLKEQNLRKKNEHNQNKRNAFLQLYEENRESYQSVKRNVINNYYADKIKKKEDMKDKRSRVLYMSLQKEEGKDRVDYFYKERNDHQTNSLRTDAENRLSRIKQMENQQNELRKKLQNSTSQIHEMQDMILSTYRGFTKNNNKTVNLSQSFYDKRFISERYSPTNQTLHSQKQREKSDPNISKLITQEMNESLIS